MTRGARIRQIVVVLLLAVGLVVASTARELSNSLKTTLGNATVEGRLVADSVRRDLGFLAVDRPEAGIADLVQDPRIRRTLLDAQVAAPSVLHVSLYDSRGRVLVHTLPAREGQIVEPVEPLPEAPSGWEALRELWRLRRHSVEYASEWPLGSEGDSPLAVVRVVHADVFLLHDVGEAVRRGILSIVALMGVAVLVGVMAERTTSRRLRDLESSIVALREGRREPAPVESGWAGFDRVARELNLLGETVSSAGSGDRTRVVERLGQMAAGVAHELRGPLQGLEFDLAELESSLEDPAAARAVLEELRGKIQRLEWVVTGFLKVARVQPLRLAPVSARDLADDVVESLETEALMGGVRLEVDADASATILGDRDPLHRALANLVSNAIEAQPSADGTVTVEARDCGTRVELAVVDSGPGIPEDRRDKVFDLYFTTKSTGTGVGLALVRQTVDLHQGDVWIDSRAGSGTRVVLSLPSAPVG